MDNKETKSVQIRSDILLNNDEYFKYIFKKTEKIVCAVFYTTRSIEDLGKKDSVVTLVEDKSITVMTTSEAALTVPLHERTKVLEQLRANLVSLESSLTLLVVSRLMKEDLLEVFKHELGMLHRSLREYVTEYPRHPFSVTTEVSQRPDRKRIAPRREGGDDTKHEIAATATLGRRERILGIIRDKGQVTIKDVSTAITDVSEKTIQRELMSLINEGIIAKEGERRWSRYSIVS